MPVPARRWNQSRRISVRLAIAACSIAVTVDVLQFLLGPLGWVGIDQALDLLAAALFMWLLGFHVLLLPTVVLEAFPVAESLPTWTACVIALILLRRRQS